MSGLNILISNDDGYNSKGIKLLASKLKKYGNIYVVAPAEPMSGASHSFIIRKNFKVEEINFESAKMAYKVDSTPVDCVRIALSLLKDISFDVVFSGINNGLNLGTDIIYSGTVGVVREAHIQGLPGIALSCDIDCFERIDKELEMILKNVIEKKLYSNKYILNINWPISDEKVKGIKIAKQGNKIYKTDFIKKDNYYIVEKENLYIDNDKNTDVCLSMKGYITMVPLMIDQTDYTSISLLENITFE